MSSNLRVSQVAAETIASETANVRLSQVAVEAVTDLPSDSNLRVAQVAAELIVNAIFQTQITGTFQDPTGAPIANGTLKFQLSADASVVGGNGQISSKRTFTAQLDSNGNISGTVLLWSTDFLAAAYGPSPSYSFTVYTANGQTVWEQGAVTIPAVFVYQL